MTTPRINISIPVESSDGLFHGRFPQGAPNAVLTGVALAVSLALGTLTVGGSGGGFTPDFFVDPVGSDLNDGKTRATAWAITSLQSTNSNNSKIAGKKVQLNNGTYSCGGLASHAAGNDFSFPALSVPPGPNTATPTWIRSETKHQATLDFTGFTGTAQGNAAANANSMFGQNPNISGGNGNITFDGFRITGGGTATQNPIDLRFSGSFSGVTIQNCILGDITHISDGGNSACVLLQGCVLPVLTNNTFQNAIKTGTQPDHMHALVIFSGQGGGTFTNNTCVNTSSGIDGKTGCANWVIAYNYFTNMPFNVAIHGFDGGQGDPNGGLGSNTAGTNFNIFHHNVLDDAGVLHSGDTRDTGSTQNLRAFNNTIFLSTLSGSAQGDMRALNTQGNAVTDPPKADHWNNLYVRTAGTGFVGGGEGFGVWDFNAYCGPSQNNGWLVQTAGAENNFSTFASFKTASGVDTNSVYNASPTFPQFISPIVVGAGPGQFALSPSSPFRASGSNPGRVGGLSGGAAIDKGAWGFDPTLGGPPAQIGAV